MKLFVPNIILAALLFLSCTPFTSTKTKVALAMDVHEIVKAITTKRFAPTNDQKEFTWKKEPLKFEFMKHDGKAQVHDDKDAHSDVNIEALADEHAVSQITYRFGMQVDGKEESLRQVFMITYLLDKDESLYIHYTNGIVDGRQEIGFNSPIKLTEQETKEPALVAISQFINQGIRRQLTQFMDKVIQTIPSVEKLVLELNELGTKMKELGSTFQFSPMVSSRAAEDPSKITSSFFDIPKELANLLQRDPYYGMIFRDSAGKEQMFVDLLGQLTGGPKDDPWHNMHLYDGFIHNKETPSFQVMFDVKEANFIHFEIASSDPSLKHFGTMEALVVFYPIRQVLVIRIKSAFFSFQVDVNVLTKPFITSTLTSLLRRIEKELFANLKMLQKQGHHYKLPATFAALAPAFKLEDLKVPEGTDGTTAIKSDLFGGNLNCKIIAALGLKVCTSGDSSKYMIAGVYSSRPLEEPVSEDPEENKVQKPETLQYGVAGNLRSIEVPVEAYPASVDVEDLIANPYLISPAVKVGVNFFIFPTSSMYDLTHFVTTLLNSFIKVDDGLDLTSGKWAPYKLELIETKKPLEPPVEGQKEVIVMTETWMPMTDLTLVGFDFTPFNPLTIVGSPKCIDIIAQLNHELETSAVKNGLVQNYKLVTKVQESRIEQVWEVFGGRILRELIKKII